MKWVYLEYYECLSLYFIKLKMASSASMAHFLYQWCHCESFLTASHSVRPWAYLLCYYSFLLCSQSPFKTLFCTSLVFETYVSITALPDLGVITFLSHLMFPHSDLPFLRTTAVFIYAVPVMSSLCIWKCENAYVYGKKLRLKPKSPINKYFVLKKIFKKAY